MIIVGSFDTWTGGLTRALAKNTEMKVRIYCMKSYNIGACCSLMAPVAILFWVKLETQSEEHQQ